MPNNKLTATPQAIAAGLMVAPKFKGDEVKLTEAGIFALAGLIGFSQNGKGNEGRAHCQRGVVAVLDSAEANGLPAIVSEHVLQSFKNGDDPARDDEFAKLLQCVVRMVKPDSAGRLISGDPTH